MRRRVGSAHARRAGAGFRSRLAAPLRRPGFPAGPALRFAQSPWPLGGPPASLRSASPRPPPSAPRSGPLPREDGCRTPGPQLLPMPGALLRPRTLLSPAAADGRSRHRTPSAPPRGGGAEGAPRAPRPRPAGQPAWQKLRKIVIPKLSGKEMMMMKMKALLRRICRHNSRGSELSGCLNLPRVEAQAI